MVNITFCFCCLMLVVGQVYKTHVKVAFLVGYYFSPGKTFRSRCKPKIKSFSLEMVNRLRMFIVVVVYLYHTQKLWPNTYPSLWYSERARFWSLFVRILSYTAIWLRWIWFYACSASWQNDLWLQQMSISFAHPYTWLGVNLLMVNI